MRLFTEWRPRIMSGLFALLMMISGTVFGQMSAPVGTPGGSSNTTSTYPTPFGNYYWGARQQFLFPASELGSAGLVAGDITALQFNVTSTNGEPHSGYTIRMGSTTTSSLTGFEPGLPIVFGPQSVTPTSGINNITFDSPFNWDGSSNVIVEICFNNTGWTNNSIVEWTASLGYNGSFVHRADNATNCTTTTSNYTANRDRRPLMSFEGTLASCSPITDLSISNTTGTSADLIFSGNEGNLYIEYGVPPFTPGSDNTAGGGMLIGPETVSPVTIPGLTAQTDYVVYVRQECSPGEWSPNAQVIFNSGCATFTAPFFESFESLGVSTNATWPESSCMGASPTETTASYRWNREDGQPSSGVTTGPNAPHDGGVFAYTEATSGSAGDIATLEVGPIDLSSLTDPALSFYYHMHGADMGTLNVYVSGDGGPFNEVASFTGPQQAANTDAWIEHIAGLGTYSGQTIIVRFEGIRGAGFTSDMAIDAISVGEAPACLAPTSLTSTGVTLSSSDLTWDCDGCTGDFYVEYGAPGFIPGTDGNAGGGTVVGPIATTSTTIPGLSANTEYDVYVRQDCGIDGFSDNSTVASFYTGICSEGGPTSVSDSNLGYVSLSGFAGSGIDFDACAAPYGPDNGPIGVLDMTSESAQIPVGFTFNLNVDWASCDGSTYGAVGTVWIDWNGDLTFSEDEVIGTAPSNPYYGVYAVTPPAGTALGSKTMRIMFREGGTLPLDPCASFTWGTVVDFTVEVIEAPDCTLPVAEFDVLADCGNSQFSIEVDLTDVGSSDGGVVNILNDGGEAAINGVAEGTYVIGPFTAGTNVNVTIEHIGDNLCNITSGALTAGCVLCTSGGPSSTFDSNLGYVSIDGFAGSGIDFDACAPPYGPDAGPVGVLDMTSLSVDIPVGFTYDLDVEFASCDGSTFGAVGTVWIDWNGDYEFSADEVVGTAPSNPFSGVYAITPPPGTPVGPKYMRVMFQEGGVLPLDPCASFTWGTVVDFIVNVIEDPGCLPPTGSLALNAGSCDGTGEFYIDVQVDGAGDSPNDEITISNSIDATTIENAQAGLHVVGPFPSGSDVEIYLEHLGNDLCTTTLNMSYTCPPPNDNCEDVTPVVLTSGVPEVMSGNSEGATGDGTFTGGTMVWEAFEVTDDCNNVVIEYCGNDPAFAGVYTSLSTTCPSSEPLVANNLVDWDICGDGNPTIYFNELPAGTYYYPVAADAGANEAGPYSITITSTDCPPPPTDACVAGLSASPGSVISDLAPTTSVITVGPQPEGAYITDLNIAMEVNHTWVSDMTISLTSPCGTTITLFDGTCGSVDDIHPMFDDEASLSISSWCSSRFGPVIPLEALDAFDEELVEGDWTLEIVDNVGGDNGTLVQWCLVPTLEDLCLAPVTEVIAVSDQSITLDLAATDGCFDTGNYDTFNLTWTGGGSANNVTLPYEVTGLDPATTYVFDVSANCTVGGTSGTAGVSGTTMNCTPEESCFYELTLTNTSGTGWGDALARVDNGWTSVDYVMDSDVSTQTWTILACPGNPISLEVINGGNGALSSNLTISLVNADGVEVYADAGPEETVLYNQANGCPDCAAVSNLEVTRLAADLVEVSWSNVELPANVNDIQVLVLIEDLFGSIEIGSETFPAGTTSGSVTLDGSYPFEFVTVQVITNCTNEGGAVNQEFATLPACDAADQCEYVVNMTSSNDGWEDYSLSALIDGSISIDVSLQTGTSGSQTIFTCGDGTIELSTNIPTPSGSGTGCNINTSQFGSATIPTNGNVQSISTCNFASEYANITITTPGLYEFTSNVATDFLTLTDVSSNIIGDGSVTPLQVYVSDAGTYRLHINTDSNCGTSSTCRATTGQFLGETGAACGDLTFEVVINPSTDDVTVYSETDFCDFEDGDTFFSGTTCPSCFPALSVEVVDVSSESVDIEWTSNNPAGTNATVYVGLPGFDPQVDPISSAAVVTTGPGVQPAVNVTGLSPYTDYEAVVIEDCAGDPADASPSVAFTTPIANDNCQDITPVALVVPDTITFSGSSVGATDDSINESYGGGQAWEAFEVIGCAQTVTISYCGSTPVLETVFTGLSTGCPAAYPDNYLNGTSWEWTTCPDGNPTIVYEELEAGIYYIPVYAGHEYEISVVATGCEGCTDPNAINYDPDAIVDDGSCIIPTCSWPELSTTVINDCETGTFQVLLDIGDEGDAPDYDVYVVEPYCDEAQDGPGFPGDQDCEDAICALDAFCCTNTWDGLCAGDAALEPACADCLSGNGFIGTFAGNTSNIDLGSFGIGSNVDIIVEHNGDAQCDQSIAVSSDVTCGCTDMAALNYNPLADEDDGSCIIPDCTDDPEEFTYCYGVNENFSLEFAPTTPGDEVIVSFTQGVIESSSFDVLTIYDGNSAAAPILYQNPAAQTDLSGLVVSSTQGNGLFATLTSDGSVSCATGSLGYEPFIFEVFCGMQVIPGCTDPSAVNYVAEATVDDGSCVFAPINDDCANATSLTPAKYPQTANALGTLSGASTNGSTACVGTNGPDVFYTFNVPLENHYWVNLNPFGGFSGVVEVLDACDGTVVACETAPVSAPFCDQAQGSAGFANNQNCEDAICAVDPFCCNTAWDGVCAGDAEFEPACSSCLSTAPAGDGPLSIFIENLPAGDYIVRVRDYYGTSYLTSTGNFLVNVQYFPTAHVQDNPNNFLYACNQTGFQLEDFVGATPQSGQGALDYQWLIAEQGSTENWTWQRGEPNYSTRIEWLDMEYGKTYNVYVRILMDIPDHGEVWGVFQIDGTDPNAIGAAECTISTGSNVTPTELRPNYTPTNPNNQPYSLCDIAIAYQVSESENFRWRFDPDMDSNNGNEIYYVRGSGNPSVMMHWVNGLVPGTIYNVAVEAQVNGDWSGFSTILPVEMALPPNDLAIRSQYCNTTMAPNGVILAESVCEADYYSFEFVNTVTGAVHTRNTAGYALLMSYLNPQLTPGVYDVRVKVTQNGIPGDFGPSCQITIGGSGMAEEGMAAMRDIDASGNATLFPNPNAGDEVRVELDGLGDGNHEINIVMYDIYGKQVNADAFGHEGDQLYRLIRFDDQLAMGMYMVHIFVDGEQYTIERLVVK